MALPAQRVHQAAFLLLLQAAKQEGNPPLLCGGVAQPRLSVYAAGWLVHSGPLACLFGGLF